MSHPANGPLHAEPLHAEPLHTEPLRTEPPHDAARAGVPMTTDHHRRSTDKRRLLELKDEITQKQRDLELLESLARDMALNHSPPFSPDINPNSNHSNHKNKNNTSVRRYHRSSNDISSNGDSSTFLPTSPSLPKWPSSSSTNANATGSSKVIADLHTQIDTLTHTLTQTESKLKTEMQTKKSLNRKLEEIESESAFTKNQVLSLTKLVQRRESALAAYEAMQAEFDQLKSQMATVDSIKLRNDYLQQSYNALQRELASYKSLQGGKLDELRAKFNIFVQQELGHKRLIKTELVDGLDHLVVTLSELRHRVDQSDANGQEALAKCHRQLEDIRSTLTNIRKVESEVSS